MPVVRFLVSDVREITHCRTRRQWQTFGRTKAGVLTDQRKDPNAQILDRLEPIAAAGGFNLPRVCTPEELMGVSTYE